MLMQYCIVSHEDFCVIKIDGKSKFCSNDGIHA